MRCSCRKAHLLATSACLSLAGTMGLHIIDSGWNLHHLGQPELESHTTFVDPFSTNDPAQILETDVESSHDTLNQEALLRKMHLQYMDTFEDAQAGLEFTPTEVISHKFSSLCKKSYS